MNKFLVTALAVAAAIVLVILCVSFFGGTDAGGTPAAPSSAASGETASAEAGITSVEFDEDDLNAGWSSEDSTSIVLNGDSIALDGSGATVDGTTVTITSAGTYVVSGTLADGQIRVDSDDDGAVRLVLNGASITCSTSAPIYVLDADKTVIVLADGTENVVTGGSSYVFEDAESDEPNAAIFSKDDLTINGEGSLTVNANYNNGIQSKDDLVIVSGTITVHATNDGIKGKDSVAVLDGAITIDAGNDGMQSTNDSDAEKGYIVIEGGTIDITAVNDGIQAETSVAVTGGTLTISTGGGSANGSSGSAWGNWGREAAATDDGTSDSAKGIKAGVSVTITGGTITIDSSDDSVHSNDSVLITGGTLVLSSGDDGVHADSVLEIDDGDIGISKSYEGLESASIAINGGNIRIAASDDGINVAGGNDGSSVNGRPGQNAFDAAGDYLLSITGGYIYIDAGGDGLDSNGSIEMSGGTVIVNGPTDNGNGPLDYNGTFTITGGFLVAAGSSGMAQAPGTSSTEHSVMVTYSSAQSAGTLVHIENGDGDDLLTFAPAKTYQSVLLCSADLVEGSTCTVYSGGSSTGTAVDGLYSGGTYTGGTQIDEVTISGVVTYAGSSAGGQSFGGPSAGGQPGGAPLDGEPPSGDRPDGGFPGTMPG